MRAIALVLVLLLAPSQGGSPQINVGGEIAAKIGDVTISLKDVDARWQANSPGDRMEALERVYASRRAALDQLIAELLIARAAKAKGVDAPTYERMEIEKRSKPVSDDEVVAFYHANLSEMQGRSLDAMAPAIKPYLVERERMRARRSLLSELQASSPALHVSLDPPRQEVPIATTDPSIGQTGAEVTLVEFSDFQCPYCQRASTTLSEIRQKYGDRVRIVWKDFPLQHIHEHAFTAAAASHCAADQGKYWQYHDRLFANQQALSPEHLKHYAADIGLRAAEFNACLDSGKYEARVKDSLELGKRLGVNSTPTIYINGRITTGAAPYEMFAQIIDEELSRRRATSR